MVCSESSIKPYIVSRLSHPCFSLRMIGFILVALFYSVDCQGVFNVVRFPNSACGSANNFNGTCYTASECSALGGASSGSCASGFGVCCVFSLACGGRTTANTSYATINTFSTTSDRDPCTYTYCKCSDDVCKIREAVRIENCLPWIKTKTNKPYKCRIPYFPNLTDV